MTCCHLKSTVDIFETYGESIMWKSIFLFFSFLMDNQKGSSVHTNVGLNYVHV